MNVTYEIRTARNTPVHRYDSEERARQARADAERKIKTPLKLFRITRMEEEIS